MSSLRRGSSQPGSSARPRSPRVPRSRGGGARPSTVSGTVKDGSRSRLAALRAHRVHVGLDRSGRGVLRSRDRRVRRRSPGRDRVTRPLVTAVGPGYVPGGGTVVTAGSPRRSPTGLSSPRLSATRPGYAAGQLRTARCFSESFDAGVIPPGWSVQTNSGVSWKVMAGAGSLRVTSKGIGPAAPARTRIVNSNCAASSKTSYLVTPPIDLSSERERGDPLGQRLRRRRLRRYGRGGRHDRRRRDLDERLEGAGERPGSGHAHRGHVLRGGARRRPGALPLQRVLRPLVAGRRRRDRSRRLHQSCRAAWWSASVTRRQHGPRVERRHGHGPRGRQLGDDRRRAGAGRRLLLALRRGQRLAGLRGLGGAPRLADEERDDHARTPCVRLDFSLAAGLLDASPAAALGDGQPRRHAERDARRDEHAAPATGASFSTRSTCRRRAPPAATCLRRASRIGREDRKLFRTGWFGATGGRSSTRAAERSDERAARGGRGQRRELFPDRSDRAPTAWPTTPTPAASGSPTPRVDGAASSSATASTTSTSRTARRPARRSTSARRVWQGDGTYNARTGMIWQPNVAYQGDVSAPVPRRDRSGREGRHGQADLRSVGQLPAGSSGWPTTTPPTRTTPAISSAASRTSTNAGQRSRFGHHRVSRSRGSPTTRPRGSCTRQPSSRARSTSTSSIRSSGYRVLERIQRDERRRSGARTAAESASRRTASVTSGSTTSSTATVLEVESGATGWCVDDIPWLSEDPASGTIPGSGGGSRPAGVGKHAARDGDLRLDGPRFRACACARSSSRRTRRTRSPRCRSSSRSSSATFRRTASPGTSSTARREPASCRAAIRTRPPSPSARTRS